MTDLIDRLRTNLRAAGIPATEGDFAGIAEKGFLSRVADVERVIAGLPSDDLPDYLDAGALPAHAGSDSPPAQTPQRGVSTDTIAGIAGQIHARDVSPVELAQAALARVAARDPQLNAFQLLLAEQAMADARAAETAIAAGQYLGPLHGVPVAVKDLLDLAGTPTTAGSKILAGNIATQDATGVARLRAAGAVIIGKTRMSEFAYSPGSNNAHYGPTANPHNLERDAGGSSSGSAVAVADGIVFAALGSDTGGSIRIPAAHCGIVGLKATHGRVSLAGAVTLSWSLDHLGPLARSVADAAIMLEAIAGPDPRDGRTLRPAPAFRAAGLDGSARGLRVGLLGDDGTGRPLADAETLAGVRRGAEALRAAGANLVELDIPEIEALRVISPVILALEAAAFHTPNLRARLDDYGEFMRQRILAAFVYGPATFVEAQQARAALRRRMAAIFQQIDILALPSVPDLAPPLGVPTPTTFTGPFNCLGWPAISIPAGRSASGMPLSIQLVARPWEEHALLRAAHAVESRSDSTERNS
ncbi:amidase [Chloroflexales bacterium ZM16-3]|nr:amidase [Chloroflexales bacterium ZM16-3]